MSYSAGANSNFLNRTRTGILDRGVVVFCGHDDEARVRFEISREALEDNFDGDGKGKLQVFRAKR